MLVVYTDYEPNRRPLIWPKRVPAAVRRSCKMAFRPTAKSWARGFSANESGRSDSRPLAASHPLGGTAFNIHVNRTISQLSEGKRFSHNRLHLQIFHAMFVDGDGLGLAFDLSDIEGIL